MLYEVITAQDFWLSVAYTFYRVLLGLIISFVIGVIIAFLADKIRVLESLLSPLMAAVKSTRITSYNVCYTKLLRLFELKGIRYFFFTNNSSRSPQDYTAKLKRLGFGSHQTVITSGDVTAGYLLKHFGPAPRAYVVGTAPLVRNNFV